MKRLLLAFALLLPGCFASSPKSNRGLLKADIYETREYNITTNEIVYTSFVYTYAETNELAKAIKELHD